MPRKTTHERQSGAPAARYRPSAAEIAVAQAALAPWKFITSPKFYGIERVPRDRPLLFVGNHTLMGVLDVPLMAMGLYEHCGIFIRSLGDHIHFQFPIWRDFLVKFGTVDGTRENCQALMRAGESILVFPGGGREVFKRRGESYKLMWKRRMGFARLAIEHGYTIVPFAAVGAEECFEILLDGNDLLRTPLRPIIERWTPRADIVPPVVRGVGLSLLPRPQRFYFHFAEPVETASYAGRQSDDEVCFAVRERVRRRVQRGIRFLLKERERDPLRSFIARLARLQPWNGKR